MNRVLLVGCTGCGRTSVGTLLGERAGWPYLDDDLLIQRTSGLTPRALYDRDGVEGLLAAGAATVNLVLGIPGPLVAGLPSGAVLEEDVRRRLASSGHVVWLRASAATLARRVGSNRGRPWLGSDLPASFAALTVERDPLYAEVASQVVDVDVVPVGAVVKAVLAGLPAEMRPAAG